MKLLSIYRNIITGDLFLITTEGLLYFDSYKVYENDYLTKISSRLCNSREMIATDILKQHTDIVHYGTYYDLEFTMNNPIQTISCVDDAYKFSKKISYINLCRVFKMCANRTDNALFTLSKDITDKIVSFLIKDYSIYLSLI